MGSSFAAVHWKIEVAPCNVHLGNACRFDSAKISWIGGESGEAGINRQLVAGPVCLRVGDRVEADDGARFRSLRVAVVRGGSTQLDNLWHSAPGLSASGGHRARASASFYRANRSAVQRQLHRPEADGTGVVRSPSFRHPLPRFAAQPRGPPDWLDKEATPAAARGFAASAIRFVEEIERPWV